MLAVLKKDKSATFKDNRVLIVSSLLRARELKVASALRHQGWRVDLIYIENSPFKPGDYFDQVFKVTNPDEALSTEMH